MSDALPLPSGASVDAYTTLAVELALAVEQGAVADWARRWIADLSERSPVAWFGERDIPQARVVEWVEQRVRQFVAERGRHEGTVTVLSFEDARWFLARIHGFESWPPFSHHLETTAAGDSQAAAFEAAADAIVGGDLDRLRVLLTEHPDLARARSTRSHHSTLLHYVSANGIEDFRQTTPPNIVAIATLLLDAGADVNAESDAYGGHSTTLGLTATSLHPERAGVQLPLLELLLARGANIEQRGQAGNGHGAVVGCLANGQGQAARFLADRGAALDLEGAAGVGRADVVATYFDATGALSKGATAEQLESAVMYAAGYGHDDALAVLLAHGGNPNAGRARSGETALHWTTYGPHPTTAARLLAAGAAVDARDTRWRATPLDWALDHWAHEYGVEARVRGYELVDLLMKSGAAPDLARYDERTQSTLLGDARMAALLGRH